MMELYLHSLVSLLGKLLRDNFTFTYFVRTPLLLIGVVLTTPVVASLLDVSSGRNVNLSITSTADIFILSGVILSPLGIAVTNWSIVPAPDDR
jgi:hypothetical protein